MSSSYGGTPNNHDNVESFKKARGLRAPDRCAEIYIGQAGGHSRGNRRHVPGQESTREEREGRRGRLLRLDRARRRRRQ